jgi:hypothetical protein
LYGLGLIALLCVLIHDKTIDPYSKALYSETASFATLLDSRQFSKQGAREKRGRERGGKGGGDIKRERRRIENPVYHVVGNVVSQPIPDFSLDMFHNFILKCLVHNLLGIFFIICLLNCIIN